MYKRQLVYEWYDGSTKLGISTFWSGQDATTLTLLHPESPEYNGKQYRCRVAYTPSAYGSPAAGAAKSTGNATNPDSDVYSDYATLTVLPTLEIQAGPSSVTSAINQDAIFTTTATVTDNSNINYRWQVNGSDVTDGTLQETSSATRFTNNYVRSDMSNNVASIVIPDDATNVKIRVAGGAGSQGNSCQSGAGGAAGQGRSGTFSIADGGRNFNIEILEISRRVRRRFRPKHNRITTDNLESRCYQPVVATLGV